MTDHALHLSTPTDREIVITRSFAAPRPAVFAALTTPELLRRWLHGPEGWRMVGCEVDLRVGGGVRYVWHGPGGRTMAMSGEYREIVPPERIVATERFDDDWTGGETLSTLVLAERHGTTTLTNTVRYASPEARDGALATRMEQGTAAGYDQLDTLLATTPSRATP